MLHVTTFYWMTFRTILPVTGTPLIDLRSGLILPSSSSTSDGARSSPKIPAIFLRNKQQWVKGMHFVAWRPFQTLVVMQE